ncbi:unnamed protein product [Symbiodinium natans]|uniref:Fe2OG dioxygenase domain-containing protein n=1 Tax=Symbiodinium natans TaxID=878477 RepID=A0A812NZB8_9DINO|nr:unnamed protein product [Symbiodinium natans]
MRNLPWLRYLKNGVYYCFFRLAPSIGELHVPSEAWDLTKVPSGTLHRNPSIQGLWLLRGCMTEDALAKVRALIRSLHEGSRPWHGYEMGRCMMPLHADPALEDATLQTVTADLDVFGSPGSRGALPQQWPRLAALRASQAPGAEELWHLQKLAPQLIEDFGDRRCLFVQAQALEAGAEVSPHRDALPSGGDLIATVVLEGSSDVRVGSQRFEVQAGDFYAIGHAARYHVEHEVLASPRDRLSVTFRYGLSPLTALPPLAGEGLRQGATF